MNPDYVTIKIVCSHTWPSREPGAKDHQMDAPREEIFAMRVDRNGSGPPKGMLSSGGRIVTDGGKRQDGHNKFRATWDLLAAGHTVEHVHQLECLTCQHHTVRESEVALRKVLEPIARSGQHPEESPGVSTVELRSIKRYIGMTSRS